MRGFDIRLSHDKRSASTTLEEDQMFTTVEVRDLTGATLRQLQHWDEQEIVKAGRGQNSPHVRDYTITQLLKVVVLQRLRAKRMTLKRIRVMMPTLQSFCREAENRMVAGQPAHMLVVSDKGRVIRVADAAEACEQIAVLRGFGTVIDLDKEARLPHKYRSGLL